MTTLEAALTFRDADPSDADWIAGLLSDEGYPAGGSDIVRRLERFAELGSRVRMAEQDGTPLGFVAVHLVPALRARRPAGARHRDGRRPGRPLPRHRAGAPRRRRPARRRGGLRVRRGHRRPPSPGRPPALRGGRLRRLAHHVPAETSLSEPPFPRLRLREPTEALLALPWERPLGEWRPDGSSSRRSRSGRRATSSASSSAGRRSTRSRRSPPRSRAGSTRRSSTWSTWASPRSARSASRSGRSTDQAILVTEFLGHSLQYRRLLMRVPLEPGGYRDRLLDAMAGLLVDLHRAGVYWGDCSLANTLFRRDGDTYAAYLVDAETSEVHPTLSDGQRAYDLDVLVENVAFGLADLAAFQGRPETMDEQIEAAEAVRDALHAAVGRALRRRRDRGRRPVRGAGPRAAPQRPRLRRRRDRARRRGRAAASGCGWR